MALLLVCGTVPLALPLIPWLRFALVPVGWLLAFGLWAGTIGVACWLYAVKRQSHP